MFAFTWATAAVAAAWGRNTTTTQPTRTVSRRRVLSHPVTATTKMVVVGAGDEEAGAAVAHTTFPPPRLPPPPASYRYAPEYTSDLDTCDAAKHDESLRAAHDHACQHAHEVTDVGSVEAAGAKLALLADEHVKPVRLRTAEGGDAAADDAERVPEMAYEAGGARVRKICAELKARWHFCPKPKPPHVPKGGGGPSGGFQFDHYPRDDSIARKAGGFFTCEYRRFVARVPCAFIDPGPKNAKGKVGPPGLVYTAANTFPVHAVTTDANARGPHGARPASGKPGKASDKHVPLLHASPVGCLSSGWGGRSATSAHVAAEPRHALM